MTKVTFAALIFLLSASAFSTAASAPQFVGRWVHIRSPGVKVEVKPNGESYILSTHHNGMDKKYVAVAEGGVLKVGDREVKANIEASSGNLILGGQEYRRLRPGETFEYVPREIPRF